MCIKIIHIHLAISLLHDNQRRLEKLLAVLEENQHIYIKRLEELMETSTSTLRRDLIELEK